MKAVTVRLMEKKHDEAIDRLIQSHKENVKEITAYYTAKIAELESTAQPVNKFYQLPAGWKLVPIEPTPKMRASGKHAMKGCESIFEGVIAEVVYGAMLNAAPTQESE